MSDERRDEPIADRLDGDADDAAADDAGAGEPLTDVGPAAVERERRTAIERIGLAAVAVVMATLFGVVAVAAFVGGEFFLAAMGLVGCMMTLAVGGATLLRG